MLQTKKIRNKTKSDGGCVAVSFDPTEILLRKSGKTFYGSEERLTWIEDDTLYIDKSVADDFGLAIKLT